MALDKERILDLYRRARAVTPREAIDSICGMPDGIELMVFPDHANSPNCWCRPRMEEVGDELRFVHKNLALGDFDA